ncbi:MAG TPA: hypothetical protein VJI74_02980 [Candidatus Paceibacterota bacterium]
MFDFLRKLQERPEEHRRAFAFTASAVVTLFIALLWLADLATSVPTATQTASPTTPSPLQTLREQVTSVFSNSQNDSN